jgi:hypothetical protein
MIEQNTMKDSLRSSEGATYVFNIPSLSATRAQYDYVSMIQRFVELALTFFVPAFKNLTG